jgi:uncharacterized protein
MHCPNDNATLQMTTRENIEIDYCPECRGVWLDRGELDKLIERSSNERGYPQAEERSHNDRGDERYERRDDQRYEERRHDNDHKYDSHGKEHHKKKEGFMGDLFDF